MEISFFKPFCNFINLFNGFVCLDYAGDGVPVVVDRLAGEIRKAQIFVAVQGRVELHVCARRLDPDPGRLD